MELCTHFATTEPCTQSIITEKKMILILGEHVESYRDTVKKRCWRGEKYAPLKNICQSEEKDLSSYIYYEEVLGLLVKKFRRLNDPQEFL